MSAGALTTLGIPFACSKSRSRSRPPRRFVKAKQLAQNAITKKETDHKKTIHSPATVCIIESLGAEACVERVLRLQEVQETYILFPLKAIINPVVEPLCYVSCRPSREQHNSNGR